MNRALGLAVVFLLSVISSCDDDAASPSSTSGVSSSDCPLGMFKPEGFPDCVFPAETAFGQPTTVSDNRCATGQPAIPPSCISDAGRRPYLSVSHTCAPNYHFEMGLCQRGGTGTGTGTGTGFPGGFAGSTNTGGFTGAGGSTNTGGVTGAGGSTNTDDFTGAGGSTNTGGVTGSPGSTGGCGGTCSDAAATTI